MRVGAARQPLLVDARLDPAHLDDVVRADAVGRVAQRVDQLLEPAPQVLVARRRRRRAAAPAPPRPSTTWRSRRRTSRGCAPADPACPRAAGRRRPRAPGRRRAARAAGAARWRPPGRTTTPPAGRRPATGSCTNMHVGVAAVGQLEAAVPAHRDDRHPGRRRVEPALLADRAAGDLERGLEGGVGQPGQRRRRRRRRRSSPSRSPTAIRNSSRRRIAADRPHGVPRVVLPAGRGEHLLGQRLGGQRRQVVRRASARPAARAPAGRWRSGRWPAAGPAARPPGPRRAAW